MGPVSLVLPDRKAGQVSRGSRVSPDTRVSREMTDPTDLSGPPEPRERAGSPARQVPRDHWVSEEDTINNTLVS